MRKGEIRPHLRGLDRRLFWGVRDGSTARARGSERRLGQLCPSDRYGVSDEIDAAALFLFSDDASYVNDQALNVDGGLNAVHPFVLPKR